MWPRLASKEANMTPLVYSRAERRCDTCGGSGEIGVYGFASPSGKDELQPCFNCHGDGRVSVDCTVECGCKGRGWFYMMRDVGQEGGPRKTNPCSTCGGSGDRQPADWAGVHVGDAGWSMSEGPESASAMTVAVICTDNGGMVGSDDIDQPWEYIADFTLDLDGDQGHRLAICRYEGSKP